MKHRPSAEGLYYSYFVKMWFSSRDNKQLLHPRDLVPLSVSTPSYEPIARVTVLFGIYSTSNVIEIIRGKAECYFNCFTSAIDP